VNLRPNALLVFFIPVALAAGAPQLFAQATGVQGSSKGLFGSGPSDANARQKLDFTLSPTEAYDSDLTPEAGTTVRLNRAESTGYSTMLAGAGDYSLRVRHVQIRAAGASSLRYNRPLEDALYSSFRSVSHTAGVGLFARLPKQTTLLVNQTATYSPSFLFNLFPQAPLTTPGDAPPGSPDYALSGSASHSYGSTLTVGHDFTRRTSLSTTVEYQNTDAASGTADRRALGSYGIRAHLSRHFSPNTAAIVDYDYRNSEIEHPGEMTAVDMLADHGINVGVDYKRPLSATRHVTFGALFGSSITILPESGLVLGIGDRYRRRMSGQVTMGYEFARGWKTGAIYRRGVESIVGLSEPISADRFTASVEGLLTRRIDVVASAGYSNGESALTQSSAFNTYTGDVRLNFALARTFAAYVEYLYYFYDSRGSTPIAPGISGLERRGVRTGLTLRVPALRR
jgi:hypothetical protein